MPDLPPPGELLHDLFFGSLYDGAKAAEDVADDVEEIVDEADPAPKKVTPATPKNNDIHIHQYFHRGNAGPRKQPKPKPAPSDDGDGADDDASAEEDGTATGE